MELSVNKTIRHAEGDGFLEGESAVRLNVGIQDISVQDLASLGDSVASGAITFVQPVNSLTRAFRAINKALYSILISLAPLSSIEGNEMVSIATPKSPGEPEYVEISVPGARAGMVPAVNAPEALSGVIMGLWAAIVDDDLVRVYFVPNGLMTAMDVEFRVRVLK